MAAKVPGAETLASGWGRDWSNPAAPATRPAHQPRGRKDPSRSSCGRNGGRRPGQKGRRTGIRTRALRNRDRRRSSNRRRRCETPAGSRSRRTALARAFGTEPMYTRWRNSRKPRSSLRLERWWRRTGACGHAESDTHRAREWGSSRSEFPCPCDSFESLQRLLLGCSQLEEVQKPGVGHDRLDILGNAEKDQLSLLGGEF